MEQIFSLFISRKYIFFSFIVIYYFSFVYLFIFFLHVEAWVHLLSASCCVQNKKKIIHRNVNEVCNTHNLTKPSLEVLLYISVSGSLMPWQCCQFGGHTIPQTWRAGGGGGGGGGGSKCNYQYLNHYCLWNDGLFWSVYIVDFSFLCCFYCRFW